MNFKIIKAVSVYTILGFIPLITSFLLLPLYTRHLSNEAYGIVSLAYLSENYFILMIVFGINSAIFRFYPEYKSSGQGESLLANSFFASFLPAVLIVFLLLFLGEGLFRFIFNNNFSLRQYGYFVFISAFILSCNQILLQYFRIKENLKAATIVTLVPFFFSVSGVVTGVVWLKMGALGNIQGRFIGLIIGFLCLAFWILKKKEIKWEINCGMIKTLLLYSYPIFLYNLIGNLSDTLDRFFLNKNFSLSTLGIYNLARTIVSPVEIVLLSIWNAVIPMIYNAFARDDMQDPLQRERFITRYFDLLMLCEYLMIGLGLIFISPLVLFFTNANYHSAAEYVPALLLASLGRAYFIVYSFNLFFEKNTKVLPIINLASLIVELALTIFLAGKWGVLGVAAGLVALKFSQFLISYSFELKYALKYPLKKTFGLFSTTVLMIGLYYFVHVYFNSFLLLYSTLAGGLITLISVFVFRKSIFKFK